MAEPTLQEVDLSTFTDNGTVDETATSSSWISGDVVLVFGLSSNNTAAGQLATPTVASGTGTGLTFSTERALNNDNGGNDTNVMLWRATATGTGSGQISVVTGAIPDSQKNGVVVAVYTGTDGMGAIATVDGLTSKTIPLTRVSTNSHVFVAMADWNQVGDVAVSSSPAGTVRLAVSTSGQADFFAVSFGDQGVAGSASYGITSHTGTVDMTGVAVEIAGTGGAAPELVRLFFSPMLEGMGPGGVQGGNRMFRMVFA